MQVAVEGSDGGDLGGGDYYEDEDDEWGDDYDDEGGEEEDWDYERRLRFRRNL